MTRDQILAIQRNIFDCLHRRYQKDFFINLLTDVLSYTSVDGELNVECIFEVHGICSADLIDCLESEKECLFDSSLYRALITQSKNYMEEEVFGNIAKCRKGLVDVTYIQIIRKKS